MAGAIPTVPSTNSICQLLLERQESTDVNPVAPPVPLASTLLLTAPLVSHIKTDLSITSHAYPCLVFTKTVIQLPPCATFPALNAIPQLSTVPDV